MTDLSDECLLNKTLLRPDEVAQILRIKRRSVYYLCSDGTIEGVKFRGTLRIKSESIRELLEKNSTLAEDL